jgi:hypothetical protein
MIELAQQTTKLGLFGKLRLDPDPRQPVQNAELLFAQPLVDAELLVPGCQAAG